MEGGAEALTQAARRIYAVNANLLITVDHCLTRPRPADTLIVDIETIVHGAMGRNQVQLLPAGLGRKAPSGVII